MRPETETLSMVLGLGMVFSNTGVDGERRAMKSIGHPKSSGKGKAQ
jgi:hypothetical protein